MNKLPHSEKKKKFSQKIGCQWIIPPQIQGLVCVGRASKWKNVLAMYLWAVRALTNHLHYGSLYHKHHVMCVLLPSSLKPVMEFFFEIFESSFKLGYTCISVDCITLSFFSFTQILAIQDFLRMRSTLILQPYHKK